MNSLRAVKYLVPAFAAVLLVGSARASAEPHSWGGTAAAFGGELVEATVGPDGGLVIERSLCPESPVRFPAAATWPLEQMGMPAAGSQIVAIYRPDSGRLIIVDLAWTRWALTLSDRYRQSVCVAGRRPARAAIVLRDGWRDLLSIADQRARDEASRLAADFPQWATDLSDHELTLMIGALARFSVGGEEALRWIHFVSRIPPGEQMLALLRVAEASQRPFFRMMQQTLMQLWRDDPAFRAFCGRISEEARPVACLAPASAR